MSDKFPPHDPRSERPLPQPRPAPRAPQPAPAPARSPIQAMPPQQPMAPQRPPSFAVDPPRPRHTNNNTANIVLTILGSIFLVVLLACGGVIWGIYSVGKTAVARVKEIDQQIAREQRSNVARQQREAARQAQAMADQARRDHERMVREQNNSRPTPFQDTVPSPVRPALPPVDPDANLPPLDKHLRWLQSRENHKIADAADWFAGQPLDEKRQSEVSKALVNNLSSGFSPHSAKLIAALAVWGSADSADALARVAQFQSQHSDAVAGLLAKYDDAKATAALLAMLKQGPTQSKAAVAALAAKGDAAKDQLIPLINDPDANLRNTVRKVLTDMKVEDDDLADQAIADAGDIASNPKRSAAVEWLGSAGLSEEKRTAATQAIAARLKDQDPFVRSAALKALMADKSKESSDALLPYVEDRQGPWNEALSALMARGDNRVAEPLGKLVKEPRTMGQALQAIRTTSGDGEDVVWHCIKNTNDPQLVQHILFALAESGTEKSIVPLKKVLLQAQQLRNGGLELAAQHALKKISERGK